MFEFEELDWKKLQDATGMVYAEANKRNFPDGFVAGIIEALAEKDPNGTLFDEEEEVA